MQRRRRPSLRAPLTWLGLALAASPVLVGWIADLRAQPIGRYVVVPAAALLVLIVRDADWRAGRRPRVAALLCSVAAAMLLSGIAFDVAVIARLGAATGLCGVSVLNGRPRLATAALGFAVVPLPTSILLLTSPGLESALARVASAVLRGIGGEVDAIGPVFRGPGGVQLSLLGTDGGIPTALALGTLGWALAVARGDAIQGVVRSALRGLSLVLLVQPLALVVAAGLVAAGSPEAARTLLSTGLYLLLLLVAAVLVVRRSSTDSMHASTSRT